MYRPGKKLRRQLNVWIPESLHRALKYLTYDERKDLQFVVADIIEAHVRAKAPGKNELLECLLELNQYKEAIAAGAIVIED